MSYKENKQHWIIFRKSEKLATAVYLLTDFFDDKESLKWRLREESISFLSFVSSFVHNPPARISPSGIEARLNGVLSFLELGRNTRLISPMNFSILREEYRSIAGALYREIESKEGSSDFEFPERFFSDEPARHEASDGRKPERGMILKDKDVFDTEAVKDTAKNHGFTSKISDFYLGSSDVYKKEFRRESILKILRTKGEITIKDIAYLVRGVSEKTIQRELISLINEGIVRREGKRRWSRYMLKSE
ncbi:MAG: DeoR family transcriptional regulator [Parcubacteria group bacterium]|nr:DeoR family transcriptional regulator [Parcubacteria group bacterium]MBI2049231.1 DeoR family transcriptional regulator [Parcubacteria group bacterium]